MWFNTILIHPPGSQHPESLTSAADVFVLSTSQCLRAGFPHSPYSLQRAQLFDGLLPEEKMDVSGQEKVWVGQRQLLCLGTCSGSSWVWGCTAGNRQPCLAFSPLPVGFIYFLFYFNPLKISARIKNSWLLRRS